MNFECPHCKDSLTVEDDLIGTSVCCPTCGKMILATEGAGFETLGNLFATGDIETVEASPIDKNIHLEKDEMVGMCRIEEKRCTSRWP
jgi:predicted Zn finger-like uncharacterized protein